MIIGLSGYASSGKDTVAKILIEDYGYTRIAFADPIRDAVYILNPIVKEGFRVQGLVDSYGWDVAKNEHPELRRLLQVFGSELGREKFGNLFWVNQAMFGIGNADSNIVITDVRFPNEASAIKMYEKAQVWRVTRPGTQPVNTHISETALDSYAFDHTIVNDAGLDDLKQTIKLLLT
jgi:hypothetical protein